MPRQRKVDHARVHKLLEEGLSMHVIAQRMNTTWSAIKYIHRKRFRREKEYANLRKDPRKSNRFGLHILNEQTRDEIYQKHWAEGSKTTQVALAKEYGVSTKTIARIVNRHLVEAQ